MYRSLLFSFFYLVISNVIYSQVAADTIPQRPVDTLTKATTDSIQSLAGNRADSLSKKPSEDTAWTFAGQPPVSLSQIKEHVLQHHPWLGFNAKTTTVHQAERKKANGKEMLFYALIVLLICFALLRQAFPKYFSDLFRLFFRTTLKQRQIREQLMQTPLPSLLLNGFFALSAGLYINLLLKHYNTMPVPDFWLSYAYCVLAVSVVYAIKFVGLKISGWLFSMKTAADSYIFIVFVVNKIIGIFLLPFIVMLAFMKGGGHSIALVLSWCAIGGLFIYRLVLTYAAVRNQVKVNPFHFFLYLCAFELAPILLLYKALLVFFEQTA